MLNPLIPELCCTDFKTSLDFYVGLLGFNILYQREEEFFAMLERQGAQLMIEQLHQPGGRTWLAADAEPPFGRGMNLQIRTTNVDDLYAHIQKSGARIFMEMEEKWYGSDLDYLGCKQFIMLDPDGYLLRFAEDLGRRSAS